MGGHSIFILSGAISLFRFINSVVLLLIFLLCRPGIITAQSFFEYEKSGQLTLYAGTGIAKYFGELSNDRSLGDVNPHLTIGISIPVKPKLFIKSEFSYYRISGADSDLPEGDGRRVRNLSFKSDNLEISAMASYGLYSLGSRRGTTKIKPYVMAGVGLTYFNPQARLDGTWYELAGLFTEGIDYDKFNIVIPLGAGIGYQVTSQLELALEMSYRFSFTDYLDDVSMNYRNPLSFSNPIAAALADRRPEIGLEKALPGTPRGNSESNDGYLFFGIKAFYRLPGSGPLRRKR